MTPKVFCFKFVDEVTLESLSQEISEIARQNKIKKFAMKKCSRKYAFEVPDIPDEADYMKFVYSFECILSLF